MSEFNPAMTPNIDMPSDPFRFTPDQVSDGAAAIADQFKKGYKTSEFWLTAGTWLFAVANGVFDLGLDVETIAAAAATTVGYVLNRGYLKRGRVQALATEKLAL